MKRIFISVVLLLLRAHCVTAMEQAGKKSDSLSDRHVEEKNILVSHCEDYIYHLSTQLEEKEKIIQELQAVLESNKKRIDLLQEDLDDQRLAYENLDSAKLSYVCAYQNVAAENRKLKEKIAEQKTSGQAPSLVPSCQHCSEMKKILIYNINGMAQSKNDSQLALALMRRVSLENETLKKRLRELESSMPARK
jgi:hypothetical protein